MVVEVKVPSVGESVTSGVVSAWHKKSGGFVNEGEPLFALETDKVSTDIVAQKSGLLETKVPEGQEVRIGEVIATIDDAKQQAEKKDEKPKDKQPEKKQVEAKKTVQPVAAGADRARPESTPPATDLSPAVRRLLDEEKIEPDGIAGTGPGGRLTKTDVLKAIENRGKAKPSEVSVAKSEQKIEPREVQPSHEARFIRKKMSPLRRKIAQ